MPKHKSWTTPAGEYPALYEDMLNQIHLLIAGSAGSGKSVLLNGIIYTALYKSPNKIKLILIDPKRVDLYKYRKLPHVLEYHTEIDPIVNCLQNVLNQIETRYKRMQRQELEQSTEDNIYIIIDEFPDLMVQAKKKIEPLIQRITQLGRAANFHVIIAAQRCTADVITNTIKVNINSRIGLRCPTPRDSRNIIEQKGAELLPMYGHGYYLKPEGLDLYKLPMIEKEEITRLIHHWEQQKPTRKSIFNIFRPV